MKEELLPMPMRTAEQHNLPVVGRADSTLTAINIGALIDKAIDAKSAVEVMERLQAMRREMRAEQAKEAFDTALAAFQEECPIIQKDKGVPDRSGKTAYRYAPLESIAVQMKPYLKKHGFNYSFDTDTASEPGWIIAKCIVTHREGHSRTSTVKFPLGTKTLIMSDTQVYAAALTFANRRAICNVFGLILAGEDMDGQTGRIKPQGPSSMQPPEPDLKALARELWEALKPVRGTASNWTAANQWMWKEEILDGAVPEEAPNISPARFREAISRAREILNR